MRATTTSRLLPRRALIALPQKPTDRAPCNKAKTRTYSPQKTRKRSETRVLVSGGGGGGDVSDKPPVRVAPLGYTLQGVLQRIPNDFFFQLLNVEPSQSEPACPSHQIRTYLSKRLPSCAPLMCRHRHCNSLDLACENDSDCSPSVPA